MQLGVFHSPGKIANRGAISPQYGNSPNLTRNLGGGGTLPTINEHTRSEREISDPSLAKIQKMTANAEYNIYEH